MTITSETLNIVLGVVALLSITFSIWKSLAKPQEKLEKHQALDKKEAENKSHILAEQLQWEKVENTRRFDEINKALHTSIETSSNHISHLDAKIDTVIVLVNSMNVSINKEIGILSTKIDERFKN